MGFWHWMEKSNTFQAWNWFNFCFSQFNFVLSFLCVCEGRRFEIQKQKYAIGYYYNGVLFFYFLFISLRRSRKNEINCLPGRNQRDREYFACFFSFIFIIFSLTIGNGAEFFNIVNFSICFVWKLQTICY